MKKVAAFALIAFLVFFAARNPAGASTLTRHLGSGLASLATGLGAFVAGLGR